MDISFETLFAGMSAIVAIISARCAWNSQQKSSYQAFDSAYKIVLEELSVIAKTTSLYKSDGAGFYSNSVDLQPAEIFNLVWERIKSLAVLVREYCRSVRHPEER